MDRHSVDYHTYGSLAEAEGAATSIAEALGHQLTEWVAGSPVGSLALCTRCGHFLYVQSSGVPLRGYVAEGAALTKQCSGGEGASS
jgi:hypothetical protein